MTGREVLAAVLGTGVVLAGAGAVWWAVLRLVQALALLAALAAVGG